MSSSVNMKIKCKRLVPKGGAGKQLTLKGFLLLKMRGNLNLSLNKSFGGDISQGTNGRRTSNSMDAQKPDGCQITSLSHFPRLEHSKARDKQTEGT